MRWDNLFDDLESQLEHELTADEIDVRVEEERLRLARMSLRERLVAIHEHSQDAEESAGIRVRLVDGDVVSVRPLAFGKDWFSATLVDGSVRHSQCIVPLAAISGLLLERDQIHASLVASTDRERPLSVRLGVAFALRDLCRRRIAVELRLLGETVRGTIDRVGRDHLDLAVHEPGSPRREAEVSHYRVIPLSQVLVVRL